MLETYQLCAEYCSVCVCDGRTLDKSAVQKLRVWAGRLLAMLTGRGMRKEEEWAVYATSRLLMGRGDSMKEVFRGLSRGS
eukprot:9469178-Pyramimonas_sp.AAC.2